MGSPRSPPQPPQLLYSLSFPKLSSYEPTSQLAMEGSVSRRSYDGTAFWNRPESGTVDLPSNLESQTTITPGPMSV